MTVDDLNTLLDFHYWARDRVLEAGRLTPLFARLRLVSAVAGCSSDITAAVQSVF